MEKANVKKDDTIKVIAGKDSGKSGKVLKVLRNKNKAIIEGINMVKRHTKPNQQKNQKGGIVEKESPIHMSDLRVVCTACSETKGFNMKVLEDNRKVRVCKGCGHQMGKTT